MPTNTTTPEAATTTTPATNTNTTPLSAMTGEEVASILVNLIRQNDGVLIQTELENALRSTGYAAIANDMAQGKQALYTLLQSKGVTIQGNESISECCTLLNAACLTLNGCQLADNMQWDLSNMFLTYFNNMFKKIYGTGISVTEGLINGMTNLQCVEMPNLTSGQILTNTQITNLVALLVESYPLKLTSLLGFGQYGGYTRFNSLRHVHGCLNFSNPNNGNIECKSLYDFVPYTTLTATVSFTAWRPTDALSSAMQNLCQKDEWDDENQPAFANNLQKFLWYFEYHFIPCFGDVSSLPLADRPVLTLYTTVESAINSAMSKSQPTKTLKQLLVDDKGWQVLASN